MMVAADLASDLKDGIGQSTTTSQISGLASAIVTNWASALVNNAPGTINGVAPPSGGPLTLGTGAGGIISGMVGSALAALMAADAGYPSVTPQLTGLAGAIVTHFLTGLVSFPVGDITGACSNTPVSPGVLVGAGIDGMIAGYVGPALASLMATGIGQAAPTAQLIGFATKLVTYVMANAMVTYPAASVTGICSAGGGPISAGAGVGGLVA